MANKQIRIEKNVYNNQRYAKVIDREFNQFTEPDPTDDPDTVQELFRLYEKLFYTIPIEGEINSHQYILQRSSELTDFEKNTDDIQPLLDEIADLRRDLLSANQTVIELQNQLASQ